MKFKDSDAWRCRRRDYSDNRAENNFSSIVQDKKIKAGHLKVGARLFTFYFFYSLHASRFSGLGINTLRESFNLPCLSISSSFTVTKSPTLKMPSMVSKRFQSISEI